jgi:soluble epoxide hydrolase/lipid-phosphate phosphatase
VWKSDLGPNDGMKNWLEQDRKAPLASYITPEEKERVTKALLGNGGMKAPLLWYSVVTSGLKAKEDKCEWSRSDSHPRIDLLTVFVVIPESDYTIKKPVFLGGAKRDYICVIDGQVAAAKKYCPDLVIKEYDSDHWVQWSHADEVNWDLLQWMEESLSGKAAL